MTTKVAFIGLGVMGYPMAGYLSKAGHDVTVYNRTGVRAEKWLQDYVGKSAATPAKAAEDATLVFTCVGNDEDLEAVTTGSDGAFETIKPGCIFVDHTTTSATIARKLSAVAKDKDVHFIDAPVSGGQAGAENGALTVMIGGDIEAVERAHDFIDVYAKMQRHLGPVGSGQLAKMVNQICIAGIVQGLSEGLHFAKAAGLDAEAVSDVISGGAAQSWQMDNRAKTMIKDEFNFGFAVDWMRKDLGYALEEARSNGSSLPVAALVDQQYAQVQNLNGGRWDTSSLITVLEQYTKKSP